MRNITLSLSTLSIVSFVFSCLSITSLHAAAQTSTSPRALQNPVASPRAQIDEALHNPQPMPSPRSRVQPIINIYMDGNGVAHPTEPQPAVSRTRQALNYLREAFIPTPSLIQSYVGMAIASLLANKMQGLVTTGFYYAKDKMLGTKNTQEVSCQDIDEFRIKEQQNLVINDEVRLHNAKNLLVRDCATLTKEQKLKKMALIAAEEQALDGERAHLAALKIAFAQKYHDKLSQQSATETTAPAAV